MASERTIGIILATISSSYPARFEITSQLKSIWVRMLKDIADEHVMAAVYDLCSTEDWAPPVSKVRARAIALRQGELAPVSAYEAWVRVKDSLHDDTVTLTDIEKEAVKQVGGTWDIKNSTEGFIISHFVKAYDAMVAKQHRISTALPEVAAMAASNAPALPSPVNAEPLQLSDTHEMGADPVEVSKFLANLKGYRSAKGDEG